MTQIFIEEHDLDAYLRLVDNVTSMFETFRSNPASHADPMAQVQVHLEEVWGALVLCLPDLASFSHRFEAAAYGEDGAELLDVVELIDNFDVIGIPATVLTDEDVERAAVAMDEALTEDDGIDPHRIGF